MLAVFKTLAFVATVFLFINLYLAQRRFARVRQAELERSMNPGGPVYELEGRKLGKQVARAMGLAVLGWLVSITLHLLDR